MPIPSYDRCHRLGKPTAYKNRPFIIRLTNYRDKIAMFRNTRHLKGNAKNLSLKDDMSEETKRKQAELYPALLYAKRTDRKARFINDKILFRGKLYDKDNMHKMPGIDITKAGCVKGNGVTLFSGELCPLSNLFSINFNVDGEEFPSNEHFYQIKKCEDYNRKDIANLIRTTISPREAMYIGKQIRPDDAWLEGKGKQIMYQGIKGKFSNVSMKQFLQETTGALGEATRHKFWGIGHNLHADGAQNISNWDRANALGKILIDLRE
jgi:ribA/ribD-fused uncharacterized protein